MLLAGGLARRVKRAAPQGALWDLARCAAKYRCSRIKLRYFDTVAKKSGSCHPALARRAGFCDETGNETFRFPFREVFSRSLAL